MKISLEKVIVQNSQDLRQFVFDLAGNALDQAGYAAETYAFHLHVAFRRNMILDPLVLPLPWVWEDNAGKQRLQAFTQKLVDEVQAAERDCWAIKLVKTEYLSYLDKARNASEHALRLLTDQLHSDISASKIVSSDEDLQLYVELLQGNIQFCDILLTLPFILEKTCQTLSKNTGINYDARKSAALLTALLDTVNLHLDQDRLISMLKFVIKMTMPSLPLDDNSIAIIQNELLPIVNRLIKADANLEHARNRLFSEEKARARMTLLASMGVHFDSVKDLVLRTLLMPVEHAANLASGFEGFALAAFQICEQDNPMRLEHIANAFSSFDNFINSVDSLQHPVWLKDANDYYQTFRGQGTKAIATLRQGLGIFYNVLVSWIPASILKYFQANSEIEGVMEAPWPEMDLHLIYLDFYRLSQAAALTESLEAHFFEAYMMDLYKTLQKDFDYQHYCAFKQTWAKKLDQPDQGLEVFMQHQDDFDMLLSIHALKQQEIVLLEKIKAQSLAEADLIGLFSALQQPVEKPGARRFQQNFIKPVIAGIINAYLKDKYLAGIEALLNGDGLADTLSAAAHFDKLTQIYSLLRLGKPIDLEQFSILEPIFGPDPLQNYILQTLPKRVAPVEIQKTPRQIHQENIKQHLLPQVSLLLDKMLSVLNKQYDACKNLSALVGDSSIRMLCCSKLAYIAQIKASLNKLSFDIKNEPDKIAKILLPLREASDRLDRTKQDLLDTPVTEMANQLMRFAWYVYPDGKSNNSLMNNVLAHYFKDTEVLMLFKADQAFTETLAQYPELAFMDILNHPLTVTHFIPGQEAVMDAFFEEIIRHGGLLLEGRFIDKFVAALPYPFLGTFVKTLFESAWIQNQIQAVLQEYAGVYTENAKRKIKNILYPLLGIAIQHSVEESALQYVYSPEKCSEKARDAFAMYYLQYRSIKDANPQADPEAFIAFLFPSLSQSRKYDLQPIIQAFAHVDRFMFARNNPDVIEILEDDSLEDTSSDLSAVSGQNRNTLEQDLQFLIENLDFSDQNHYLKIQLMLINKFLLLAFEAAENTRANELQANTLAMVRKLLNRIPPYKQEELSLLLPAIKQGSGQIRDRVLAKLDPIISKLDGSERNRQSLKNFLEPLFGKTVFEVEYAKAAGNDPWKVYSVVTFLMEILVTAGNWAILLAAIQLSLGGMQSLYIFLGVAGAIGATATQAGIAVLALVFLASFLIKFVGEIYSYRHEFTALRDEKYSLLESIGRGTLYVLICFATALSMTFMMDFFISKLAKYLPLGPLKKLWKGLQTYPEAEALAAEEQHFFGLKIKLNTLKMQIQAGDFSPEVCLAIDAQITSIAAILAQAAQNDRGILQSQYQQEFEDYQAEFSGLKGLLEGLGILQAIHNALPDKQEIPVSKTISNVLVADEKIRVDIEQYCQKRYPADDQPAPGLLSNFYVWLEKAGQFMNWRRPGQAEREGRAAETMSLSSWEKSMHLMSSGTDPRDPEAKLITLSASDLEDPFFKSLVLVNPCSNALEDSMLGFEEVCGKQEEGTVWSSLVNLEGSFFNSMVMVESGKRQENTSVPNSGDSSLQPGAMKLDAS